MRYHARLEVTELDLKGAIQAFDVSPDGTHIVFDRVDPDSDVVVMELGSSGR